MPMITGRYMATTRGLAAREQIAESSVCQMDVGTPKKKMLWSGWGECNDL